MTLGSACEKAEDKKDKMCRYPGSNRGPLDLQSNALPTELSRLCSHMDKQKIIRDSLQRIENKKGFERDRLLWVH